MILTVVIIAGSTLGLSLGQSSSGVRDCGHNEQCVSTEKCPEYLIKRKKLSDTPRGPQYERLLAELKSQVCNKAQRKICCPPTPPTPSGECGLSKLPSGFIIGGVSAEKGEFPFLALIGERKVSREVCLPKGCHNEYETRWFCAGNIINTGWVLTAAHCKPRNETFIVRLGEHILEGVGSYDPDVTDMEVGIQSFISHQDYQTKPPFSNDIALVRLPRPARPSQVVQVVCLPWGNFSSSLAQTGMVVGWGKTSNEQESINKNTGVFSKKQQKLEVPIQIQDCPSRSRVNSSTQICAGGELGKDSCNGDSGGGLFWREGDLEESDSAWYLLGITSFGSKSCGVGRSAVYTRVSAFLDWIETNIKKYE